ncbi:CrcB family protein [Bacillaceae bacterium IKA-2]|nr:CrcB family protein [Bacillaceae bacterium IKA-2]
MEKKHLITFLAVGIGGGLGTLLRYLINIQTVAHLFPLGTLLENLIGSFLLGLLTGWIVHLKINEILKTGLGVGFCGGFTTMSTLAADVNSLIISEYWLFISFYLSTSIFGGVALAFIGYIWAEKGSFKYKSRREVGEVE